MNVFYGFGQLPPLGGAVVTIGSYDGVHYGHRQIIEILHRQAARIGGQSVVLTFSPHPRQVLGHDGVKLLNSLEEKTMLLEEAGVDNLVVVPFDEAFSRITSRQFIADWLVARVGMKVAVVGYNHRFGHDKERGFDVLESMKAAYGFDVVLVERCGLGDRKVSSTEVRKAVESGDMPLVREMLCRPYIVIGCMESDGRLVWDERDKLLPPEGEYSVTVKQLPCGCACGAAPGVPAVAEVLRGGLRLRLASGREAERSVPTEGKVLVEFV